MGARWDYLKASVRGGMQNIGRFIRPGYATPPTRNTEEWLRKYGESPRFGVVAKIATDLSIAEGKLYDTRRKDKHIELDDHPFLDFWHNPSPLPEINAAAFWRLMETYLFIKGEAAALIDRDEGGRPIALWPVPPHWVIDMPYAGHPYYRIQSSTGQQQIVPMRDVYMQRELNPLDPYRRGLGSMEQLADEIETDEYMAKYAKRFFYNNATPEILIHAPGLVAEQMMRFEEAWLNKFGGVGNARRPAFIPTKEVNVHRLTDSQREMDFGESRKNQRDIINQHMGVSPEILGITENSNRATATQAKIIYAENVLTPRLLARQEAINQQLVRPYGDDLMWVYNDIVPQDSEFKLTVANEGLGRGALLVNEWREANGYDPIPNGDVLYVPFSVMAVRPNELLTPNARQPEVDDEPT